MPVTAFSLLHGMVEHDRIFTSIMSIAYAYVSLEVVLDCSPCINSGAMYRILSVIVSYNIRSWSQA